MANTTTSPNMGMPVPVVGTDPGPDWATNYDACLSILDGHDHTAGSGVQLTPNSININTDFPFNNNNATALKTARFQSQLAPLAGASDLGCLYEVGADLYYNDGNGNQIRFTQSGSVVGASGTITGLPSGTASASFSVDTFAFQRATNISAFMDFGAITLRNNTFASKGLTLSPPNAMGSDYGLTLPSLPAQQSLMTLDSSGNITAPWVFDNSTIAVSGGIVGIPANVNLIGNSVQANSKNLVVSNTNATAAFCIIRCVVEANGVVSGGEGVNVTLSSAGTFIISFINSFADTPAIVVTTSRSGADSIWSVSSIGSGGCIVHTADAFTGNPRSDKFSLIAIGQRT